MQNLERELNKESNIETLSREVSLTKQELEAFRKLPKEQQEKQKQDKLAKLSDLQNKLDQAIQEAIKTGNLDEAKILREQLEKEIGDLEQQMGTSEISAEYTNPDGKKETLTLNIEQKIQEFTSFYKKTKVDLQPDFEETVKDIWERNQDEIKKAIEENGFDDMLIIPADLSIKELSEKMKMENGYFDYIKSSNNVQTLDDIPLTSKNTDKSRIVFVHKTQNLEDRPELKATLNTKGKDVKLDQALTIEEYLVFQRKYFEETGKHLDENGWTWLATKSGTRLVYSRWFPDADRLYVRADDLETQDESLGVRPSRSFF